MLLYVVTGRRLRPDLTAEQVAVDAAGCGADMVQIREKDLTTRCLVAIAGRAAAAARAAGADVYVNGRPDIALAAGAHGVHLPADGLPAEAVASRWSGRLRVGVSTHGVEEVRRAAGSGADFVVFGPVFETASKRSFGPPLGVDELARAVRAAGVPVLGIGGVTRDSISAIALSGAAGAAVIRAVIGADDMTRAARALRTAWSDALGGGTQVTDAAS